MPESKQMNSKRLLKGPDMIRQRVLVFVFIVAGAVAAGIYFPFQWLGSLFNSTAYYFVLVAFITWMVIIIKITFRRSGRRFKTYLPGLLVSAAVMFLVFHCVPPQFKILKDETNLVGVSMAMHENKTVTVPWQGLGLVYANYNYEGHIDPRPPGYPFFISLIHGALGYSAYNGFVVNFLAGMLALFLIYVLLTRSFSEYYGLLGILLTTACPIFLFWMTSSGFEALNLFFVVFVFFSLYTFLRSRRIDHAELLFLSLVLLAYCRYESAIFILGLIILWPFFTNRIILNQYRLPTLLCPVLLVPLIWQRRLCSFSGAVQNHDLRQVPDSLFGLDNLVDHFSSNMFVLSGLDTKFGFLPLVFVLAVVGLYLILKNFIHSQDRSKGISRPVILYGLVCSASLFLLYSAFYWGDFSLGIDNRLALVFLPVLIITAVIPLYRLLNSASPFWKRVVIFLAIIQMIHYWPVGEKQLIVRGQALTYEYSRMLDYINTRYNLDRDKILIISDRPSLYTIHKLGSVSFLFAKRYLPELRRLQRMYYDHVLVLQRPNPHTGEIKEDQSLPDDCHLDFLKEIPVGPVYCMRISEAAL